MWPGAREPGGPGAGGKEASWGLCPHLGPGLLASRTGRTHLFLQASRQGTWQTGALGRLSRPQVWEPGRKRGLGIQSLLMPGLGEPTTAPGGLEGSTYRAERLGWRPEPGSSRVAGHPGLPETLLVLTLRAPCPWEPLQPSLAGSPRTTNERPQPGGLTSRPHPPPHALSLPEAPEPGLCC